MKQKILALLVVVALVLTACVQSQPGGSAPAAATGGAVKNDLGVELLADAAPLDQQVLRYASIEGKHFDTMRNEYEGFAYETTIETLAKLDADGVWHPAAADSWEVSEDGRTWTFHLRKDAKWSDGTPITAKDWVYSFHRYFNKRTHTKGLEAG